MLMQWASYFSPTQLNPLDLNPLRDLIHRLIDFDRLRAASPFKLFIAATHTNTAKLHLFRETDISAEVLLASACLPKVHRTVEIDGQPYWDGGFSANPAIYPLFYECDCRDVLLVLLSPLVHEATPRTTEEIAQRTLELTFSAHFMREMRMFVQATDFARASFLPLGRLERRLLGARFHMIESQDLASLQRAETKVIAHGPFLELLRDQGRERAQAWLAEHAGAVGRRTTVDLRKWFG
jgi:NTE family protein